MATYRARAMMIPRTVASPTSLFFLGVGGQYERTFYACEHPQRDEHGVLTWSRVLLPRARPVMSWLNLAGEKYQMASPINSTSGNTLTKVATRFTVDASLTPLAIKIYTSHTMTDEPIKVGAVLPCPNSVKVLELVNCPTLSKVTTK